MSDSSNVRWEYKILGWDDDDDPMVGKMNKLGKEGWELAGTREDPWNIIIFKRKLP
jgi:hypothetical protein